MKKYNVYGMTCAACQTRIENTVKKLDKVENVTVNLLTNSMQVEGEASSNEIIKAVKLAGYDAKEFSDNNSSKINELDYDSEFKGMLSRLFFSVFFLVILMYFSMGHMMLGFPLPYFLKDNHIGMGLVQLLLSTIILIINQKFFISGTKAAIHLSPNMDTLVALGSMSSYLYSIYSLFAMTYAYTHNSTNEIMKYMDNFYFESAAMILTLITVGKTLEAYSKGKTTNAIKKLMLLAPDFATIITLENGKRIEKTIDSSLVKKGDIFILKSGERIPVDGKIISGSCSVDESAITGESIPVDKTIDDLVASGTVINNGYVECVATNVGEDSTLAKIIQLVSDAGNSKAPIAKIADKISAIFVPSVLLIALITFITWLLLGKELSFALTKSVAVLVVSCPCALGLATPVAIMVGNGIGAKNGILFKNATALENCCKLDIICFDKTGTLTKGHPVVTDIYNIIDEDKLLTIAGELEKLSEHPLAKAISDYYYETIKNPKVGTISDFKVASGFGVSAKWNDELVKIGNIDYIPSANKNPEIKSIIKKYGNQGKTAIIISIKDEIAGVIAVADTVKDDAKETIINLKNLGIIPVMLTGDNEYSAKYIADKLGIDDYIAEVKPEDKDNYISQFKNKGLTAMVGDGINDAPSLTRADIGIAIGAGTDIAIESADIVLSKSKISDVVKAINLSRNTNRNIYENLFWAFIYNLLLIPLAIGVYYPLFKLELNPMLGALAMSMSSVCVVTNALRLNLLKIDKKIKPLKNYHKINLDDIIEDSEKEDYMEKVINIEGMMCTHCEATVKLALLEIDGVKKAKVSHRKNTAVVKLTKEVDDEVLKNAVESKNYTVVSIENK